METVTKRLYEGMFLVDSALAAADWDGTMGVIENILKRADAEVVSMRKWSERRLAYDIDHKSRGTYILAYFKADGRRIAALEKDVQLSEKVMRVLVLGTEKRPAEVIEADVTGVSEEQGAAEAGADERSAGRQGEAARKPKQESPAPQPAQAAEGESSQEKPKPDEGAAEESPEPQAASEAGSQEPQQPE